MDLQRKRRSESRLSTWVASEKSVWRECVGVLVRESGEDGEW